jgi:hypothetical protein
MASRRCASSSTSACSRPSPGRATASTRTRRRCWKQGKIDGKDDHLGRHAPPGDLRDQRQVRRPVPVHQRQGQPAPGGDRPARLRDQADRRQPDLQVRARRRLRHPEHRVRHRGRAVRRAAGEQEVLPARGVQREVPRRRHLLEVRPQGRPHRPKESFSLELPPYSQDLSDAGKGPSDGWSFTNSFCSERYVGGIEKGRPPYEAGCSAKDTDYLHVINWKKAAELVKAGKAKKINGHNVHHDGNGDQGRHPLPGPRAESRRTASTSPRRQVHHRSGKLDTHVSVYSFEKIQAAIKAGKFESKDPYGIPVIGMKDALHVQVPLGLGPLHTQYDSKAVRRLHLAVRRLAGRQVGLLRRQGARQDQRALQHRPPDDHGRRLGRSQGPASTWSR